MKIPKTSSFRKTSSAEMISYSFRIVAMARGDYVLTTQRNSRYSRRHYRYKTKQEAEAHAAKWARRVKAEERRLGRPDLVIRRLAD
jgi:hypothetical protein